MRFALLLLVAACGTDEPDMMMEPPPPGEMTATAAQLRAVFATCNVIGGPYSSDSGETANISICGATGAVAWTSDFDVDCDGKMSTQCNLSTDPAYMSQTAATDSMGDPLDAATLPYVVVPGKSTRFDYRAAGLAMGSVFAVVYNDEVQYAVAGDVGPVAIVGEGSYALADLLGIDPDPRTGGTDEPVLYIGFTNSVIDPIEDHDEAVSVGLERARALVQP
jgi:Fungal chitosanase of glycosyl hydrolase group 75